MEENHPQQTGIAAICDRLHDIAEALQQKSVEELGTGRPVNSNVAEAIQSIESVRADLQAFSVAQPSAPLDREVEQDRMERAVSELDSGEFDMQG
jgi:hypothetical protein